MQHTHESGRVEKTIGAEGPRGQTRRLLLEHASILLGQGQIASAEQRRLDKAMRKARSIWSTCRLM